MKTQEDIADFTQIQHDIINEVADLFIKLGAEDVSIMSTIMSWGDTMCDKDVLEAFKELNRDIVVKSKADFHFNPINARGSS